MSDSDKVQEWYREPEGAGNAYRVQQYGELQAWVERERADANRYRQGRFRPSFASAEAYAQSAAEYRRQLCELLGRPLSGLSGARTPSEAKIEDAAGHRLGGMFRLTVQAADGLSLYGLLFLPDRAGPFPLVLVQHGGSGTPELCAGLYGPSNYNGIIRRFVQRGCAVFAPQLHLWAPGQGPEKDRKTFDTRLKQLGSSIAAVEIFKLMRGLDYLQTREDIDCGRIGMAGLSYGGFYTLFTAALDERIKAAYSSCFFNNRFVYDWSDWTWFDSGRRFLDAEIAGLVCPRPLYIELGLEDELFDVSHARVEAERVRSFYERLGLSGRLRYKEFQGGHEFAPDDAGVEFICEALAGPG
ncbi:Alpha/beta hydrolase family protein [Paenibacillus sp. UNCCL117]|uniref:alpha/beta hydrolase family protein n=1 Tax=unclassified Paenibacillus TaxID=185978 RepID=UPI00087FB88E|nr:MULTISPECIES: dienelactone hydrolase family protein [unclassified Paenibacillus]SDD47883.1 Alpha/beta hydrolase family protein [Paenibacillus sp. cl123]SFW50355.1 Alpha/beta hydrolase family protein [Paenibacillus sp. UNCCL117]